MGCPTAIELANWPGVSSSPALASADREAGITPPFAAIAARLEAPPSAMISSPGTRRFAARKPTANA